MERAEESMQSGNLVLVDTYIVEESRLDSSVRRLVGFGRLLLLCFV